MAAPDPREPLNRMLSAIRINDAEMRILLRDSAREAQRLIESLGDGLGADIRTAQLDLAQQQGKMWAGVEQQTRVAIADGVDAAGESATRLAATMFGEAGIASTTLRASILAQARSGIESIISRGAAGIPLSQQVYKTSTASGGQLDRLINAMLLNGSSAREIAKRVHGFIDPLTPGGASYAAMRLGRTELNNAFHTTSVRLNNENPTVESMKWNLSRSHPKADQCDEYANESHMPRGEPGVYPKGDVPSKPHPQCFCFITPVTISDDEFVRNFKAGKYDSYINQQLSTEMPVPQQSTARAVYRQIQRESPMLRPSAVSRETARRLGVDHGTLLRLMQTRRKR